MGWEDGAPAPPRAAARRAAPSVFLTDRHLGGREPASLPFPALTCVACLFFSASGRGKASCGRGGASGTGRCAAPPASLSSRLPLFMSHRGVCGRAHRGPCALNPRSVTLSGLGDAVCPGVLSPVPVSAASGRRRPRATAPPPAAPPRWAHRPPRPAGSAAAAPRPLRPGLPTAPASPCLPGTLCPHSEVLEGLVRVEGVRTVACPCHRGTGSW